ncbi:DNA repair protein rad13 [Cyphellophora attinorum]|uniref:DNA repair protein rad13 n=1 Tax=Cyphellophora attinorum TaxID=1664694 RepID=A0A0N0NLX1_9EURO|nr:DNA repair protein rad13 [Phialophora attinorum]KPI39791.1 DNA repair protein rad13 [Phialophora attinorum]
MGVTNLWTVVSPTARPTSLASLNRKRLAVDASIWIYQFLKAVRDKEGNALRNSHVVGFFRRICKLLYFGIKPVFVFDGGAPVLKRETVRKRRSRREGRREDAVRTAGKLLAVQMERVVEEEREKERRRRERGRDVEDEDREEDVGDEGQLVYVDEIGMGEAERRKGRAEGFKRRDQYHLPDLDVRIEDMGAPNDPRIMSQVELEEYARQFHSGEDINLYDFSKIDFESPFFLSLPAGDRYNILNAARLRSRLRMGYTKDQLNGMFPDRMAFSKFQIERVKERNELTQRLMHINGMADDWDSGGRIAGEKGKEYVLVRNEGVEGGWALGVVSNKLGTSKGMAIDVDEEYGDQVKSEEESDEFEDVEIEGLNRLPKSWKRKRARSVDYDYSYEDAAEQIAKKRKAVYDGRKAAAQNPPPRTAPVVAVNGEDDPLFVPQEQPDEDDDLFEDVDIGHANDADAEDDLQKAIAMSLEDATGEGDDTRNGHTKLVSDDEDDMFGAALAASRKSKPKAQKNGKELSKTALTGAAPNFSGPLPFESMNLGQSLLGKKKAKKVEENLSGGFDRNLGEDAFRKERPPQPAPSWFDAAPKTKDMKRMEDADDGEDGEDHVTHNDQDRSRREVLHRHPTREVIDLEAEGSTQPKPSQIELSSDDDDDDDAELPQEPQAEPDDWQLPEHEEVKDDIRRQRERDAEEEAREARYAMAREIAGESDMPDEVLPPAVPQVEPAKDVILQPEGQEVPAMDEVADRVRENPPSPTSQPNYIPSPKPAEDLPQQADADEDMVEWSASEPNSPLFVPAQAEDDDDEFEDVPMNGVQPPTLLYQESTNEASTMPLDANQYLMPDEDEQPSANDANANDPRDISAGPTEPQIDDDFSDSDEELMRQLANEVEEHARFTSALTNPHKQTSASTSNGATATDAALRDYEQELKQLRSQQKSNLRDADEVTQTMITECQSLLSLFGLPYITAPMEAEAQCAELVRLGLVDGIVTDDSDIFLFGGTRIYKNMFNAQKFVECYLASDLEKEYTLTREKLIQFAHLLGSDYTEGVPGVGPVTALEILTDFPSLTEFAEWVTAVQRAVVSPHPATALDGLLGTPFRRKFKSQATKKLFLPNGFPDLRVDKAYLEPEVDSDPSQFQWGVPDLEKLRSFLMATIGWTQERTDEVLVPVIRDMNKREKEGTQANITRWFEGGVGVGGDTRGRVRAGGANAAAAAAAEDTAAGLGQRNRTGAESGRMKNAFKRLRGEAERKRRGLDDDYDEEVDGDARVDRAEKADDIEATAEQNGSDIADEVESLTADDSAAPKKKKEAGRSRATTSRKAKKAASSDDASHDDEEGTADDESYQPSSGRKKQLPGRARGGGRRKAKAV